MTVCHSSSRKPILTLSDMWLFCFPGQWGSVVNSSVHVGSAVTRVIESSVEVDKASVHGWDNCSLLSVQPQANPVISAWVPLYLVFLVVIETQPTNMGQY